MTQSAVLDLRLGDLRQMFDSLDPAPFRERDLDPKAAEYIVDWARECPADQPLALLVHLGAHGRPEAPGLEARSAESKLISHGRPEAPGLEGGSAERTAGSGQPSASTDSALLADAVHEYFRGRAAAARQELSRLFRTGRISLVIGLAVLAAAILTGEAAAGLFDKEGYAWLVKESLVIGGWVALWRPLEIFLYDWWPILAKARLYDRLAVMQVSVRNAAAAETAA